MTTRIVVARPEQTLARFMERHLVEHSFQALPVVDGNGVFLGMVSLKSLKSVPPEAWDQTPVSVVMDSTSRTVCASHSMAVAEKELALGHSNYLPVVEPSTDQLIGILSSSDVMRARQHAQDVLETGKAKVTVMHRRETQPVKE
jgi:CBS-domain-containing membrane protein